MIHFMPLGHEQMEITFLAKLGLFTWEIFVDTFSADTGRDLVGLR